VQEIAIDLSPQPLIRFLLVPAAVQHDDRRVRVLLADVRDEKGKFFVHGASSLLPLALDDEIGGMLVRMKDQKVAKQLGVVDAASDRIVNRENRLIQKPLGIELPVLDELVAPADQRVMHELLQ
jgi:hypothetical protein